MVCFTWFNSSQFVLFNKAPIIMAVSFLYLIAENLRIHNMKKKFFSVILSTHDLSFSTTNVKYGTNRKIKCIRKLTSQPPKKGKHQQ